MDATAIECVRATVSVLVVLLHLWLGQQAWRERMKSHRAKAGGRQVSKLELLTVGVGMWRTWLVTLGQGAFLWSSVRLLLVPQAQVAPGFLSSPLLAHSTFIFGQLCFAGGSVMSLYLRRRQKQLLIEDSKQTGKNNGTG